MFLTGFILGSVVAYIICLEEDVLPLEGKIGLSVCIGFVLGLITMMVFHVGLFLTGIATGLLAATAALLVMNFFYSPNSLWLTGGVLTITAVVFSILIMIFQKGVTIIATAVLGSALMCVALDYFLHVFFLLNFTYDVIRLREEDSACWNHWLLLSGWPLFFAIGLLIQLCWTARNVEHRKRKYSHLKS